MGMMTLRLRDDLDARIAELATSSGHTKTYWVTRLIAMGLNELEYEVWEQKAISAYLAEKKLTSKDLEEGHPETDDVYAWILDFPGNPELQARTQELTESRPAQGDAKARKTNNS
jgi:predicted transcriptional regulator